MRPVTRRSSVPAAAALAAILLASSATLAGASSPTSIHVLLDVRAEWGRALSECVSEGVFLGFHSGTARYFDQGTEVVVPEDVAGVWWYQTDVCDESNSFFVTGDVLLEPGDFFIDRQLRSASIDVEVPVTRGDETYTFAFDLAYEATGDPTVAVIHDGSTFIRQERLASAHVTGTAVSDVPVGFAGFDLIWSDIGRLTQVQSGG